MTIAEFFLALATDAGLRERFAGSPEEVLRESGLNEKQQAIVRSASLEELRVKVEAEFSVEGEKCSIWTIWWIPTIWGVPPPPPPPEET